MKICILVPPYTTSNQNNNINKESPFHPDILCHVNDRNYEFSTQFLSFSSGVEEMKQILMQKYDYLWNYMKFGKKESELKLTEKNALEYLETMGIPIIGPSSKFHRLNQLNLRTLCKKLNIRVPKWRLASQVSSAKEQYPIVVQYVSYQSLPKYICETEEEMVKVISHLESNHGASKSKILIEDFIIGRKITCIVIETTDGMKALNPVIHDKEKYTVLEKSYPNFFQIQDISIRSFFALGVNGSSYAQVYLRIRDGDDCIFVTKVNHTPKFFSPVEEGLNADDYVISESFPGGHNTLIEILIASKARIGFIEKFYQKFAGEYDEHFGANGKHQIAAWQNFIENHNFDGRILDLGCGTGLLGKLIMKKNPNARMIGVDMCEEMTSYAMNYEQIIINKLENVISDFRESSTTFDHIICSGVFQFLDPQTVKIVWETCFNLAKSSIAFSIEELPQSYIENLKNIRGSTHSMFNHIKLLDSITIPKNSWQEICRKSSFFWPSPQTGDKIFGTIVCYKKIK